MALHYVIKSTNIVKINRFLILLTNPQSILFNQVLPNRANWLFFALPSPALLSPLIFALFLCTLNTDPYLFNQIFNIEWIHRQFHSKHKSSIRCAEIHWLWKADNFFILFRLFGMRMAAELSVRWKRYWKVHRMIQDSKWIHVLKEDREAQYARSK